MHCARPEPPSTLFMSRAAASDTSSASSDSASLEASGSERESRLEHQLQAAQARLAAKEAQCDQLLRVQKSADADLHDLTEQLFTEAYKLVNQEKAARHAAEKRLAESRLQAELLEAEVCALKAAVRSGRRSLAQRFFSAASASPTARRSRALSASRSVGQFPQDPQQQQQQQHQHQHQEQRKHQEQHEQPQEQHHQLCPQLYLAFLEWRSTGFSLPQQPSAPAFLSRVLDEDVRPCLRFVNKDLSTKVYHGIRSNELEIEKVRPHAGNPEALCTLTQTWTECPYRMKVNANADWLPISTLARNRVAAVCDFFTYARYLSQGIVAGDRANTYWTLLALRKNITLAKMGLAVEPVELSSHD